MSGLLASVKRKEVHKLLSEYIENLLNTNEFELEQKQKEYNELLQQQQEIESWIENLKKENDLEQNIFSPRIAAAGGLGKLNQARTQLLENEKQQEEIQKQLEELKKKQKEYQEMLAEADKERQNVGSDEKSPTLANTGDSDAEKVSEPSIQETEQIPEGPEKTAGVTLEELEKTKKLLCEEAEEPTIEEIENITELRLEETEQITGLEAGETEQTTGLILEELEKTKKLVLEESDQIDESVAEEKTEQTLEEAGKAADSSTELAREEKKKIAESSAEQATVLAPERTEKITEPEARKTEPEARKTEQTTESVSEIIECGKETDECDVRKKEIELEIPEASTKEMMTEAGSGDSEATVGTTIKQSEEKTSEKEKLAEQSSLDLKTADITARIKEAIERKNRLLQADEENEILRRQVNEFQNLLSNLYKKTELCMALMNGDRNKCRKELQEMKKMIKQYSEQMK